MEVCVVPIPHINEPLETLCQVGFREQSQTDIGPSINTHRQKTERGGARDTAPGPKKCKQHKHPSKALLAATPPSRRALPLPLHLCYRRPLALTSRRPCRCPRRRHARRRRGLRSRRRRRRRRPRRPRRASGSGSGCTRCGRRNSCCCSLGTPWDKSRAEMVGDGGSIKVEADMTLVKAEV